MNAEQRPLNRGARGWEAPTAKEHDSIMTPEDVLDAMMPRTRPDVFVSFSCDANGMLDLVEVNGVWMTPEDARKA